MADAEAPGDRIAQALKAAGLRPVDLARRLKVSQPTVHGWVNNLHGVTWVNVRRVAAILKVPPGWIMFGSNEEAERTAQTPEELAFLRLFRGLDDPGQASMLRLMTAMPLIGTRPESPIPPPKGPEPPRPFVVGGRVKENRAEGCPTKVVPIRAVVPT